MKGHVVVRIVSCIMRREPPAPVSEGASSVRWLSRRVVGAAAAGLCLFGVVGTVTAAAADDAPGPVAAYSCGGFDGWSSTALGTHVSTTAVLGSTTATLEGTTTDVTFARGLASPTLTIHDGDVTTLSGPVDPPQEAQDSSGAIVPDGIVRGPEGLPDAVFPLCVAHFPRNDNPVVLVGLFTGGAHCCTVLRAYPVTGSEAGTYRDLQIGNPGVNVRPDPHGLGAVVVTADDAFNYQFAPYAFSGVPVKVLTFEKGGVGFVDVTRTYQDLVRGDAAQWWESFSSDPSQGLGTLAAWVADQCLLDKGKEGWAMIDQLLAEGKLAGPPDNGGEWPAGAAYVAALHTFLPEHGYCR
jgi:hypothetical protein